MQCLTLWRIGQYLDRKTAKEDRELEQHGCHLLYQIYYCKSERKKYNLISSNLIQQYYKYILVLQLFCRSLLYYEISWKEKNWIIVKSFHILWKYYLQIAERAPVCSDGNNLKQLSMQTVETLLWIHKWVLLPFIWGNWWYWS